MDSDDDLDAAFFSVLDQLEAQHHLRATQQPPVHQRGSQPPSPLAAPAAVRQQQVQTAPCGGPGFVQQQAAKGPLQQTNGNNSGGSSAAGQMHKPPLPSARQHAPLPQQAWPAQPPPGVSAGGVPPGRVSLAAAELQAQAAGPPVQQWRGPGPAPTSSDAAARLAQLQSELSRSEGQNKLLASNLQQRERDLATLKQRLSALERSAAGGAAAAGVGAAGAQRSTFAVAELQKQLESLRQQLLFKEQEMDDLKRQHSERTERLRSAEASVSELKGQLRQQAADPALTAAAGQQQESEATAAEQQRRPRSAGRPSSASAAPAQRSSGQKRRQSGGPASTAADASAGAADKAPAEVHAGRAATQAEPAPLAAAPSPPLLDPAVLAAARSLSSSHNLVSLLMAACSSSMALLVGADPQASSAGAMAAAQAAAPTALLLRSQLAAVARAPDAESLQFVAAFVQRVQQVACGMLPATALLDSIAGLVASALVQLQEAAGSPATPGCGLPEQRLRLIAAGLDVAQHLVALDASCAAAAAGANSSGLGTSCASAPRLSTRVTFSSRSSPAVPTPAAAAAVRPACAWRGAPSNPQRLPAAEALVQQHLPVFAPLAGGGSSTGRSVLLPLLLGAALWLGQEHEAIAGGALGALVALARALQGEARSVLAPVLTTGSMELFMHPPGLRLQAITLLHLLLEEPSMARLFEGSLAQAAAERGEPGPPTATAGNVSDGGGTPGTHMVGAGGGGDRGMPGGMDGGAGSWTGAAAIAERLLDSFNLDDAMQPAGGAQQVGADAPAAAEAAEVCGAVARAGMQLVAGLLEARQHGILVYLLLDDACGAPGCMLPQQLVKLAEAALAMPGEEGAIMVLSPAPWPESDGGCDGGGGPLLQQQAAWQQRLRVAQEALTLLRGLLLDEACSVATMDELTSLPAAARLTLNTLSRLSRVEAPAAAGGPAAVAAAGACCAPRPASAASGAASSHGSAEAAGAGGVAAAAAPLPPPALLAPWARAIGSATDQPAVSDPVTGTGAGGAPPTPGALPSCSVEDVLYMAKSTRRRVQARLLMQQSTAMQQG